jgi:low affinity Fe/Cu permease
MGDFIDYVRTALTSLGVFAAHPVAFGIVVLYVAIWLISDPSSFDWHAAATVATWFMTLVIQRAEHRDTQAIHAKLDEILKTQGSARNEVALLDQEQPEAIEEHREQEREGIASGGL